MLPSPTGVAGALLRAGRRRRQRRCWWRRWRRRRASWEQRRDEAQHLVALGIDEPVREEVARAPGTARVLRLHDAVKAGVTAEQRGGWLDCVAAAELAGALPRSLAVRHAKLLCQQGARLHEQRLGGSLV
eukprot:scaffold130330_cov63-Phaeocystis_antarctica.AAC.2